MTLFSLVLRKRASLVLEYERTYREWKRWEALRDRPDMRRILGLDSSLGAVAKVMAEISDFNREHPNLKIGKIGEDGHVVRTPLFGPVLADTMGRA